MEQCPVCYESNNLIPTNCGNSHSICHTCLNRWTQISSTCPMCRNNIEMPNSRLILGDLILLDSNPVNINICIPSPKGTSLPIRPDEIDILRNIFGEFNEIYHRNIPNIEIGRKVMFQNYKDNCWWFGFLEGITDYDITFRESIYLTRHNGSIYNASPSIRTIEYSNCDKVFLIN